MTIKQLMTRFFFTYVSLAFVLSMLLRLFGSQGGSWLNVGVLAASVILVCSQFAQLNGRYFAKDEKLKVFGGLLAIDMLVQFFFGMLAVMQAPVDIDNKVFVLSLGFVALMDAAMIYLMIVLLRQPLLKRGIIRS